MPIHDALFTAIMQFDTQIKLAYHMAKCHPATYRVGYMLGDCYSASIHLITSYFGNTRYVMQFHGDSITITWFFSFQSVSIPLGP